MASWLFFPRWPLMAPAQDEWKVLYQIVVPVSYRDRIANDHYFSGHLGVNKTADRITPYFYLPGIYRDVAKFCRTCHSVSTPDRRRKETRCHINLLKAYWARDDRGERSAHVLKPCNSSTDSDARGITVALSAACGAEVVSPLVAAAQVEHVSNCSTRCRGGFLVE